MASYLTLGNVKIEMENVEVQVHKSNEEDKELKDYSCFMCGNSFKFQIDFEAHVTVVHIKQYGEENEEADTGRSRVAAGNVINTEEIEIKEEVIECNAEEELEKEGAPMESEKKHYKVYRCKECHKQFGQSRYLKQHMVIHRDEKPYSCNECQKHFSRKRSLEKHVDCVHRGVKPYTCNECQKQFTCKTNLRVHKINFHSGIKRYTCAECHKLFERRNDLKRHWMVVHRGMKTYSCAECHQQFSRKGNLKEHCMGVHTDQRKTYNCNECHQQFCWKQGLTRHVKRVHRGIKPYSCKECLRQFTEKIYLKRHIMNIHGCNKHQKQFTEETNLLNRQMNALETSEQACQSSQPDLKITKEAQNNKEPKQEILPFAGIFIKEEEQAVIKDELIESNVSTGIEITNEQGAENTEEEEIHKIAVKQQIEKKKEEEDTRQHTHSCKQCHKKFARKSNLVHHVKSVHCGVKPYSCKECPKKFSVKAKLEEHTTIVHRGVKPYCKQCDKHFGRKSSLQRHMICVHNGE